MSENGEIYTAGKNFTLPPALTALTNSTSGRKHDHHDHEKDHLGHNESHEAVEDGVQEDKKRAIKETEFVTFK